MTWQLIIWQLALLAFAVWFSYRVGRKVGTRAGWNMAKRLPCVLRVPEDVTVF